MFSRTNRLDKQTVFGIFCLFSKSFWKFLWIGPNLTMGNPLLASRRTRKKVRSCQMSNTRATNLQLLLSLLLLLPPESKTSKWFHSESQSESMSSRSHNRSRSRRRSRSPPSPNQVEATIGIVSKTNKRCAKFVTYSAAKYLSYLVVAAVVVLL